MSKNFFIIILEINLIALNPNLNLKFQTFQKMNTSKDRSRTSAKKGRKAS